MFSEALSVSLRSPRLCVKPLIATLLLGVFALNPFGVFAATNDLSSALQRGLFEEEANRNLDAAAQAYQAVSAQFDKDRKLAATAIFRLGEVYRKQNKTNEAVAQYERIVREFADQETLATLSRQNLTGLGVGRVATASTPGTETAPSGSVTYQQDLALLAKLNEQNMEQLRRLLPTLVPDPLLTQLLSQFQEAEVKQEKEKFEYSSDHPYSVQTRAVLKKLDEQILARIKGIIRALEMRVAVRQAASAAESPANADGMSHYVIQVGDTLSKIAAAYRANGIEITAESILAANPGLNAASLRHGQSILIPIKSNVATSTTFVTDAEEEEIRRLQTLIQNSPDLINGPASGDSPLYTAAGAGWLRVATFLLDNGANVNKPSTSSGRTPLHQAVRSGAKAMTEQLLQRGADVNARDGTGGTALHQAAEAGFLSVTEVLLKHKADLNARNSNENGAQSPLHLAAKNGHAALVGFLITNGDDANRKSANGDTPLHLVAAYGRDGVVERLLKSGANVNATNNAGVTPLMNAADNGHLLSVRALLAAKANSDLPDKRGRTALSYAVGRGHSEVVNALLDAKADVNAGTADSPLLLAVRADNAALAERLLRAGADPNRATDCAAVTPSGQTFLGSRRIQRTPLQAAVLENHPAMAMLLLQSKGNARADNGEGLPLVLGTVKDPGLLEAFLKAGADPNAGDSVGRFLLTMAASGGYAASVELLLKHGANVNIAQGPDGMTALHIASMYGDKQTTEVLLAHKADVNLRDKTGKTPLDYAKQAKPRPTASGATIQLSDGTSFTSSSALSSRLPPVGADASSSSNALVTLLRQHGALDDLPDFTAIRVTRHGIDQPRVVFTVADKSTNQFTLLETVMWFYRKSPVAVGGRIQSFKEEFPFPDMGKIVIRRPGRSPTDAEQEITVSLLNSNNVLDCAMDVPVQFGDVIEIPERVHSLNEVSTDPATEVERVFMEADRRTLPARALREPESFATNSIMATIRSAEAARATEAERLACLRKTVQLTAVGQTATFTLDSWKMAGFLRPALGRPEARAVLRSSSDLSRVKVTRKDSVTGKPVVLTVDATSQLGLYNDLWLQDGDVIEVPDRP